MHPAPPEVELANRIRTQLSDKQEVENALGKNDEVVHFIHKSVAYKNTMGQDYRYAKEVPYKCVIFCEIGSEGSACTDTNNCICRVDVIDALIVFYNPREIENCSGLIVLDNDNPSI